MRLLKGLTGLMLVLGLTACGGGGGGGCSVFETCSPTSAAPTAADLTISLSSTTASNSGSDTVTATATAVDSGRNALAGIPVTFSVDNNAVAVVGGSATDTNGKLTAAVQIGNDKSNRIVTITAKSGTLTRTASFLVTGAKLQASILQATISPGATGQIDYRLTDANANPMTGVEVTISAPGVAGATGTTDNNGSYSFVYTAPATPGNLNISATAGGATNTSTVVVSAGAGTIPNVVSTITSASVSANPSVVSVNAVSSSANRTEIRALFLTTSNAPVKNVRVRFDMDGDANSIGGAISSGTNLVYSDASGIATTAYIPANRSSPTDGVTIRACYFLDDTAAGSSNTGANCTLANSTKTTLTVVSDPLAVTIGTDNTITEGSSGLTYIKRYVVLVVDASGQAKADVQITPSIDLTAYTKGFWETPTDWVRGNRNLPTNSLGFIGVTCSNEDTNRNGVLEAGEDTNSSGSLDPRKSDVAISVVGSNKTSTSGTVVLQIEYPKNVAGWIDFLITVSANGVSGTEGRATWSGTLPIEAQALKEDNPPAFVVSPYGYGAIDIDNNGILDTKTDCSDKR